MATRSKGRRPVYCALDNVSGSLVERPEKIGLDAVVPPPPISSDSSTITSKSPDTSTITSKSPDTSTITSKSPDASTITSKSPALPPLPPKPVRGRGRRIHDAPSSSKTPSDNHVTPADSTITPRDSNVTPTDSQVTPTDSQVTPTDSQVTPTDSQVTPTDSHVTTADSCVTPAGSDASRRDYCGLTRMAYEINECGWYAEDMTWKEAGDLLEGCDVGTFLLRNSAHPNHLLSLSMQTERGPCAVRIKYNADHKTFSLDTVLPSMYTPSAEQSGMAFDSVIRLVEHCIEMSAKLDTMKRVKLGRDYCSTDSLGRWMLADGSGTIILPIKLRKTLLVSVRGSGPPSLQHLCRVAYNQVGDSATVKEIPKMISQYMELYPYTI